MRIIDALDRGAYFHPDRIFCMEGGHSATYAGMQAQTRTIALALQALDVCPDTKVALLSPNCASALACIYGIDRAGAIRVPLNTRNAPRENIYIIENFDVSVVLYHSSQWEAVREYQGALSGKVHWLQIDTQGADSLHALAASREGAELPPVSPYEPLRVTSIYPTGGTTGKPKAVMHTQQNWAARTACFAAAMPIDEVPVHLIVAPLTHGAGSITITLTAQGATHVILDGFDAKAVMSGIQNFRVTHLFLPPTALYALLAHPDVRRYDYRSLRYFMYGAAPSSPAKIREAISIFGPVMMHIYGQTEALAVAFLSPKLHMSGGEPDIDRMRSCGTPHILTDVRVIGADGQVLEHLGVGEIEVRGQMVMAGYFRNEAASSDVLRNGWLRTGDTGYIDEAGLLYIVDRSKDMIITGGFNVYPAEVESVANMYDGVQDCVVVGVPDDKWGEAVKLIVQLKPGCSIEPESLKAFCKKHLGSVKAPKSVEVWKDLPRSPIGKILRKDIKSRYWQEAGRTI